MMLTATGEAPEPAHDPFDPARIDPILEELRRVWKRNPQKRLMEVVMRAARDADIFAPTDLDDGRLLYGLQQIGPGLPAPEDIVIPDGPEELLFD